MKKRLLCLALALTLLFALAVPVWGYSGFQDFLNATGRLKGVDYTRIRQDTRQYIRVTFEIGSQSFNGMLKKGYRLEDKLCRMLPISREQTAPILEKLRMESNVTISREVTHTHARLLMDQLRDIDIKTQRVISPDGSSIYYVELV